jgi:Flp pilus assembly protein TadD/predicted  nucleic acid-binding Zn-ribbon protein
MKNFIHVGLVAAMVLAMASGCSTPAPSAAGTSAEPAGAESLSVEQGLLAVEASALRQEVYQLKAGLASLQMDLAALSNRLSAPWPSTAADPGTKAGLEKLQSDVAQEQALLRTRLAELGRQLEAVRSAPPSAAEPAASTRDLAEAAEREQQVRSAALAEEARLQNEIAALRKQLDAAQSRSDNARELKKLQKELEEAQRRGDRDRSISEEREKQIRALRDALQARDEIKPAPAPVVAPVIEPTPVPEPAVVTEEEAARSEPAQAPDPAPDIAPTPTPEPAPVVETAAPVETPKPAKEKRGQLTPIQQVASANVALQRGDLARAMALFRAALAADDSLVGARIGLAACAYSMDDLEGARTRLEEVLAGDPQNVQALGLRGILNWREGRLTEADDDSARAVAGLPGDAQLRNYRGIILHALGQSTEAREQLREAIRLDAGNAESMLNLAILLASASPPDLKEATEWYDKALAAGAARDEGLDRLLQAGSAP